MPGLTWPWRLCVLGLPLLVLAVTPTGAAPAPDDVPQRLEPAPDPEIDALLGPRGAAGAAQSARRLGNGQGSDETEGDTGSDPARDAGVDQVDGPGSGDGWLTDGESEAGKPRNKQDDGHFRFKY